LAQPFTIAATVEADDLLDSATQLGVRLTGLAAVFSRESQAPGSHAME
jgi:hypothetical protein